MVKLLNAEPRSDFAVYPARAGSPQVLVVLAQSSKSGVDCGRAISNLTEAGSTVFGQVFDLEALADCELLWQIASTVENVLDEYPTTPVVLACDDALTSAMEAVAEIYRDEIKGLVILEPKSLARVTKP